MNIQSQIKQTDLVVAQLAANFTLLALAPYDSWSHEGSPAEMAAYVVETARERGNLGFVTEIVLGNNRPIDYKL